MLKVAIKYKIIDMAINVLFNNIVLNFITTSRAIPVHDLNDSMVGLRVCKVCMYNSEYKLQGIYEINPRISHMILYKRNSLDYNIKVYFIGDSSAQHIPTINSYTLYLYRNDLIWLE